MCAERRLFWNDILAQVFPQGTVNHHMLRL